MLLALALFGFLLAASAEGPNYAHVWCGGDPDTLVTVDWTVDSSTYGQVQQVIAIPNGTTRKTTGNLPHHITSSTDGLWLVAGGLLSFFVHVPSACGGPLSGGDANGGNRDDVFIFLVDLETSLPSFHSSLNLPGGCTDEFHIVPGTWPQQFIVSQMCDDVGNSPGSLQLLTMPITPDGSASYRQWGWKAAGVDFTYGDAFNPHGGEYHETYGFIIMDFGWPASLLNYNTRSYLDTFCGESLTNASLTLRNTFRVFDTNGILQRTYTLPGVGYMSTKYVWEGYGVSSGGSGDYSLVMVDSTCTQTASDPCYAVAYDLEAEYGGTFSVGLPQTDPGNQRMMICYGMRWVVLFEFDVVDGVPQTPFNKIWDYDFGTIAGPTDDQYPVPNTQGSHYIRLNADLKSEGSRFIVVNSFLDPPVNNVNGDLAYECQTEGNWPDCQTDDGVATFFLNFHGAREVASFTFGSDGLPTIDTAWTPNLQGGTPHSVALSASPRGPVLELFWALAFLIASLVYLK